MRQSNQFYSYILQVCYKVFLLMMAALEKIIWDFLLAKYNERYGPDASSSSGAWITLPSRGNCFFCKTDFSAASLLEPRNTWTLFKIFKEQCAHHNIWWCFPPGNTVIISLITIKAFAAGKESNSCYNCAVDMFLNCFHSNIYSISVTQASNKTKEFHGLYHKFRKFFWKKV